MLTLETLPSALLVDLDGTIADSHAALRTCFENFLLKRGIEAVKSGEPVLINVVTQPR